MNSEPPTAKTYLLLAGRYIDSSHKHLGAAIVPSHISHEVVEAAWSYAVRYSAKGLDVPDWDAAFTLLKQRHPSWQIEPYVAPQRVAYNPEAAENDVPDEA